MRIEVLYFDGCPNYEPTHASVLAAVKELAVEATIASVKVESDAEAVARRFLGSPSVRIDGEDIEGQIESDVPYSLRCRRYPTTEGFQGHPPKDIIVGAIRKATRANGQVD